MLLRGKACWPSLLRAEAGTVSGRVSIMTSRTVVLAKNRFVDCAPLGRHLLTKAAASELLAGCLDSAVHGGYGSGQGLMYGAAGGERARLR